MMPFREHIIRIVIGMVLANSALMLFPGKAGHWVVVAITGLGVAYALADIFWLEPKREADRIRRLRNEAISKAPNAPRTAAGFPKVSAKNYIDVYPYGCPDAEALRG